MCICQIGVVGVLVMRTGKGSVTGKVLPRIKNIPTISRLTVRQDMWHLKGFPYEVQRVALERAKGNLGFAWFLDQGLGKTAVALNEITDLVVRDEIDGAVVVCINSLKGNWRQEAENWGVKIPVTVWPNRPTQAPFIFVINFEAFIYDGADVVMKLCRKYKTAAYIDESHKIKNPNGGVSKSIMALRNEFKYRRLLTGTPMTNNVMDLWPQLTFINAIRSNPYSFRNRFATLGGFMGKQVTGAKNEDELQGIMARCCMRATKDQWLDLPEKIYPAPRQISMTKRQTELYRGMEQDLLVVLDSIGNDGDPDEVAANLVITQLLKLQQLSTGFIIREDGKVLELMDPNKNPKVLELKGILESSNGKVLVFCKHRYVAGMLLEVLRNYGCSKLVGGMTDEEVAFEKSAFNCSGGNKCLVAQLSVGSTGHTLLGGPGDNRCSTTVFFENDFNLGNRMQAEDRNHRIGQDKAVVYIDFVASSTDTKIILALQKKHDLVKAVIDSKVLHKPVD